MKKIPFICFLLVQCALSSLEEEPSLYTVHFQEVPAAEFVQFVSRITKETFLYNHEELDFTLTFSAREPVSSMHILRGLVRLLDLHKIHTEREGGMLVLRKTDLPCESKDLFFDPSELLVSAEDSFFGKSVAKPKGGSSFSVYKLQYHDGAQIVDTLKKMVGEMGGHGRASPFLVQASQSLQWVSLTNSLIFSADPYTASQLEAMIASLDVPLKQVFIEILVIETDVQKGIDFGLQWAASGQYDHKLRGTMGNFALPTAGAEGPSFSTAMQEGMGGSQMPLVPGFDLGVIGDIITHGGKSFLSLGSLVSALEADRDCTIVLNQKIITQDSKQSKIFVGDNIPFTGSVVTTVGASQQTTANIEYRDVGVSLDLTPKLGDGDVITLHLAEEITEAVHDYLAGAGSTSGIRTTKTNMLTQVHVPDKHFLILSGMIRNAKAEHRSGIPCLGGLPWIGAMFSKTKKQDEKRNVVIFVRPQIIHSFTQYAELTKTQEGVYKKQGNAARVEEGLELLR